MPPKRGAGDKVTIACIWGMRSGRTGFMIDGDLAASIRHGARNEHRGLTAARRRFNYLSRIRRMIADVTTPNRDALRCRRRLRRRWRKRRRARQP